MRYPGVPTEALFLADCVAGRSLAGHTMDAVDRLPVCTVGGASLCGGMFVLCRSVGVGLLCETRRPLSDRLACRHC